MLNPDFLFHDSFFSTLSNGSSSGAKFPFSDVSKHQTDDKNVVSIQIAVAGYDVSSLKVEEIRNVNAFGQSHIIVSSQGATDTLPEGSESISRNIKRGKFRVTYVLPHGFQKESAVLRNGLLTITASCPVPKKTTVDIQTDAVSETTVDEKPSE